MRTPHKLTLQSPLVLPEYGAAQVQVAVGEPNEAAERPVGIYARQEDASTEEGFSEGQWICHASGVLSSEAGGLGGQAAMRRRVGMLAGAVWPPEGSRAVDVEGLYDHLAGLGLDYGPAFQGLRAAWRLGNEVFAEVSLPEDHHDQAGAYGVHPALLDAALHTIALSELADPAGEPDDEQRVSHGSQVQLPFAWSGVSLHASGASFLRVALSPTAEHTIACAVADETGRLVASVDSLTLREIPAEQLAAVRGAHHDSLFRLQWTSISTPESADGSTWGELAGMDGPLESERSSWVILAEPESHLAHIVGASEAEDGSDGLPARYDDQTALGTALEEGRPVPQLVIVDWTSGDALGKSTPSDETPSLVSAVHEATRRALGFVQQWSAESRLADSWVVFVTQGAVAVGLEDIPDLAFAAVWGLIRSAQSEYPGRLTLIDLDQREAILPALAGALASEEPQLAVRDGELVAPRLARATAVAGVAQADNQDGCADDDAAEGIGGGPLDTGRAEAGDLAGVGTVLSARVALVVSALWWPGIWWPSMVFATCCWQAGVGLRQRGRLT